VNASGDYANGAGDRRSVRLAVVAVIARIAAIPKALPLPEAQAEACHRPAATLDGTGTLTVSKVVRRQPPGTLGTCGPEARAAALQTRAVERQAKGLAAPVNLSTVLSTRRPFPPAPAWLRSEGERTEPTDTTGYGSALFTAEANVDTDKIRRELIEEQRLVADAIIRFERIAERRTRLAKIETKEGARTVPGKPSSRQNTRKRYGQRRAVQFISGTTNGRALG
jgi:hypothetical protein